MTINQVLIADDNEMFRETIARTFFEGQQVDYASNADEAITKVYAGKYNLIITDNQMEDGHVDEYGCGNSGIYAIEQIRKTNITVPIIFWTSDCTEGVRIDAIDAGANEALSKRARLAELRETINRYLKK